MIVSRYFLKLRTALKVSNCQSQSVCLYKITHKIMGFITLVLFGIVFIWYLASVKQTDTH